MLPIYHDQCWRRLSNYSRSKASERLWWVMYLGTWPCGLVSQATCRVAGNRWGSGGLGSNACLAVWAICKYQEPQYSGDKFILINRLHQQNLEKPSTQHISKHEVMRTIFFADFHSLKASEQWTSLLSDTWIAHSDICLCMFVRPSTLHGSQPCQLLSTIQADNISLLSNQNAGKEYRGVSRPTNIVNDICHVLAVYFDPLEFKKLLQYRVCMFSRTFSTNHVR